MDLMRYISVSRRLNNYTTIKWFTAGRGLMDSASFIDGNLRDVFLEGTFKQI